MSSRIDSLKNLIEQDPTNSRFRYMLAMETLNGGDLTGAAQVFDELIRADPNYVAAYFHGGQTLEKLGRLDDAKATYQKGVEVTTASGDSHTRSELQGALDMLA